MSRSLCSGVIAAIVSCAAACSDGTTLLIDADVSQVRGTQQLHLTGVRGERLVFGPTIRPESAGAALEGRQTLRVLLPDDAAGALLTVRVEALVNGEAHGAAQADVEPVRNEELRVELALAPTSSRCAGCEGCCADRTCIGRSVSACGAGGVVCFACDATAADQCTAEGRCACGAGPACSPQTGADRCVDGQCRCGTGPACPGGTACDNGVCRCTAASCAGCCAGNTCEPGTVSSACGSGGAACDVCSGPQTCSGGACG